MFVGFVRVSRLWQVKHAKQNIGLQSEEKHQKEKQVQQYFHDAVFHHVAD